VNPRKWIVIYWIAIAASPIKSAFAAPDVWSLESATRRVLEVAPERRQAESAVEVRREELSQAGRWPNPSVDFRADNRVGHLSGQGGNNLSQMAITQPLPIRRLARQRAAAEASLYAAQSSRNADLLVLEREASRVFLAVQYAVAKRQMAQERLQVTDTYTAQGKGTKGDKLRRYLTPLERQRLTMLREEAQQAWILAQREYENANIEFHGLLAIEGGAEIEVAPPAPSVQPPELAELEKALGNHPSVAAARHETESAESGVEVAESQRYADPALKLFRERDFLNGTFYVTGAGISVEVPLWNENRALEGKAKALADTSRARQSAIQRDAHTRLEQAYLQLVRLREQSEQMRIKLVEPARNVLELTRRSFASGEANVLALVDANNTYFDIRTRYLDLLQGCAQAQADLRLAAGKSIVDQGEQKP
jgi:cobalt-zinc-cadmium efflux system outer membrane protein